MTEEQVRTGMAILNKIKELENYYKGLDKFKEYVRDKESGQVEIQLHEQWVATPFATVSKKDFIDFLVIEQKDIERTIQTLKEELANI